MKKSLLMMVLTIAMLAVSMNLSAQDNQSKRQRMSREQMAEAQAKHIARGLTLDDATTQKFVKTFCDCQKEMWAVGLKAKPKKADMTDAEVEQAIKAQMERSQKLLDLREKYFKEYGKFLTPKQIQRVYEMEKQTMKRLGKRGKMGKRPKQVQRSKQGQRQHRSPQSGLS